MSNVVQQMSDVRHAVTSRYEAETPHAGLMVPLVSPDTDGKTAAILPASAQHRKAMPITSGVLDYFPLAVAEVARTSFVGNEQHNPGQPLHWARDKSDDHADCIARHLIERGRVDSDGVRHSAKLAWRALALLQLELEAAGKDAT